MTALDDLAAARRAAADRADVLLYLRDPRALAAAETARRAERALALAIRAGQAAGSVRRAGARPASRAGYSRVRNGRAEDVAADRRGGSPQQSPRAYATRNELHAIYRLADRVTDAQFEAALAAARAGGNLSRAAVLRALQEQR